MVVNRGGSELDPWTYTPTQAGADVIRKKYPGREGIVEEGNPGQGYFSDYRFPEKLVYDCSKVVRATGQGFTPWPQTVVDTIEKLRPVL